MKEDLTLIVGIVDKSASMMSMKEAAIEGWDSFIKKQAELPGEARVWLNLFSDNMVNVKKNEPLHEGGLTAESYVPEGNTALIWAVGKTIDQVGAYLAALPEDERPAKVMVCILTDGEENWSQFMPEQYKDENVKERINHQKEKYGWEFVFIAAGPDQWSQAKKWGVENDYFNVGANAHGMKAAFATYGHRTSAYRTGVSAGIPAGVPGPDDGNED